MQSGMVWQFHLETQNQNHFKKDLMGKYIFAVCCQVWSLPRDLVLLVVLIFLLYIWTIWVCLSHFLQIGEMKSNNFAHGQIWSSSNWAGRKSLYLWSGYSYIHSIAETLGWFILLPILFSDLWFQKHQSTLHLMSLYDISLTCQCSKKQFFMKGSPLCILTIFEFVALIFLNQGRLLIER